MSACERAPVELSVVVPMFDEAQGLDAFIARVTGVLEGAGLDYEIVCVNDGSRDDTLARLREHRARDARIKVVNLSRNFGQEPALCAGLALCRGRAVVPIDADLQDPPEVIPQLVAKWREGFDVVYAVRLKRAGEGMLKRATSHLFWRFYNALVAVSIPPNCGVFRLMSRRAVDAFNKLPEKQRFIKTLLSFAGYRSAEVAFERAPRVAGESKWPWGKMWNYALDGITAFSTLPLRVWSYIGLGVSATAFGYAVFLMVSRLVYGGQVPGYASLMVVVLFLGGVQLITLGVLGEYIGRVFHEVKGRPTYIVESAEGLDDDDDSSAPPPPSQPER